jgi:Exopolysaccharide biosynthesis protein
MPDFIKRMKFLRFIEYISKVGKVQAILFNTPLHGNIGDHAIAVAEKEIFSSLGISVLDFPWAKKFYNVLAKLTPKDKIILITGGGFIGDLWKNEEKRVENIIQSFKHHRIIIMPQTVHFDFETEGGREFFERAKQIFSVHPSLTVFLREKISYAFMKKYMPKIHVELVPDTVMMLQPDMNILRSGILVCLRNDKEKTMTEENRRFLFALLNKKNDKITYSDTVVSRNIGPEESDHMVELKLKEFAASELVITDRLHGMIFAAVTETPCIVINSRSHKIKGCYEWLKKMEYVRFLNDINNVPDVIEELKAIKPIYDRSAIVNAMEPLYKILRK